MNTITVADGRIALSFGYDPTLVAAVRDLPGRKWDKDRKQWLLPLSPASVAPVRAFAGQYGFVIDAASQALLDGIVARAQALETASRALAPTDDLVIPGLRKGITPRPYQIAGIHYGLNVRDVFIGDGMGLGKTFESMAILHVAGSFPAIVVCPASVKFTWASESRQFFPGTDVLVLESRSPLRYGARGILDLHSLSLQGKLDEQELTAKLTKGWGTFIPHEGQASGRLLVVINYDVLAAWTEVLAGVSPVGLVLDEAHLLKERGSQRTKAAKALAASPAIRSRIALSGTPSLNQPIEFGTPLDIIGQLDKVFGSWWEYAKLCGMRQGKFGMTFKPTDDQAREVHRRLRQHCYLRREKRDVMPELPAKIRTEVPLDITNRTEYRQAEKDLIAYLKEKYGTARSIRAVRSVHLAQVEVLKQVAARGLVAPVLDWCKEFLAIEDKLIVVAHHKDVQRALYDGLVKQHGAAHIAHIFAEDSAEQRDAVKTRFQTDPSLKVLVLSLKAGGVGLTLTAASHMAIVEMGWTPGEMAQVEDRAYGRTNDPHGLNAYYFIARGTIYEKILGLLERKRRLTDLTNAGEVEKIGRRRADIHIGRSLVKWVLGKVPDDQDDREDIEDGGQVV